MAGFTIRTIEGENVDILANSAMAATLGALVVSGNLTAEVANEFADRHVCLLVESGPFKRMMNSMFGKDSKPRVVVLKVVV